MDTRLVNLDGLLYREDISFILTRLSDNGFPAYVVGGAVRDGLLGLDPGDVDILTLADTGTLDKLFSDQKTRLVGKSFSVTLVNGVEVASSRTKGDFPVADLGMRDLTINSMAWDPFTRILVDPFKGRQDLENKVIRFTDSPCARIQEDPLRMVRACRFAARYDSCIEPESFAAIQSCRKWGSNRIPGERTRMELLKAMSLARPSLFFSHLYDTGLLSLVLPCLDRCRDLDGGPFHGETVFEHCLLVGDALPARQPLLRLAGYLHDVGKFDAARIKDGKLTFAGHETRLEAMEKDLDRLRFSNKEIQYMCSLVRAHMRPLTGDSTPRATRRLLAMLDDLGLSHRDFLRMRIADKKGNLAKTPYTLSEIRVRLGKIRDTISGQTAFNINDLKISGRDIGEILGLEQGPAIGRVKGRLFESVLETPELNTASALKKLVREMKI